MNGLRHFLLALQFFTRLPVTGRLAQWVGFSPQMLRASAAHFPGVGWLVGAVGAAVFVAVQAGLPGAGGAVVAALLSTIATVWLTGAFHEDGLADVADGLGGTSAAGPPQGASGPLGGQRGHEVPSVGAVPADRARALEIMKDSRIGAFGAIALVLALGLKVALLALLAGQGLVVVACAILSAHVLSRLAPLFLIRWLPYVGDSGASKAKPLADAIDTRALLVGVLWSIPAALPVLLTHGGIKTIGTLLLCAWAATFMARLFRRRLQGFTGDGLGATQQVCELAIYFALAWQA